MNFVRHLAGKLQRTENFLGEHEVYVCGAGVEIGSVPYNKG